MKVCTAHDAHSSEFHRAEALLGIFFVSSFSAFLSEALLGLFCKHFFRISLSLIKARNCRNPQKCGRLEALKKIRKCGKIRKIPIPGYSSRPQIFMIKHGKDKTIFPQQKRQSLRLVLYFSTFRTILKPMKILELLLLFRKEKSDNLEI